MFILYQIKNIDQFIIISFKLDPSDMLELQPFSQLIITKLGIFLNLNFIIID
jgi:hypothetical protein